MANRHPIEQFTAPNTILKGVPLKNLIDSRLVGFIGESFADVHPEFNEREFAQEACEGLERFELKDRARHIAHALARQLPEDSKQATCIIVASLGPELKVTQDYGLAPFFYMAHSEWIAHYAIDDLASGLLASYELTKRYSSEFCIRPFILKYESETLNQLNKWCEDPNPHVRRLASEGTRSRLPWAMRLKNIQQKPELSLPILEKLKDDPELYVRRSVANHLGDIAKDHLELVLDLSSRWLTESQAMNDSGLAKNRRWLIRHTLRYPAKKEHPRALEIRRAAK